METEAKVINLEESGQSVAETTDAPKHVPAEKDSEAMPASKSTSPAFQFYPKDFLSSSKVQQMSLTEVGAYTKLLCHCWLDGGLPDDVSVLARLVGMKQAQFARIWAGPLHECFEVKAGRLVNRRMEAERLKQADFRRRASDWGKKGGRPANKASVEKGSLSKTKGSESSPISNLQSPISNLQSPKKERKDSPEPPRDPTPTVLTFAVVGDVDATTWALTQGRINGWLAAYPNVDVLGECRKAAAWVDANPDRRKTAKGMPAFLVRWLGKAADNGRSATHAGATAKTAGNIAALQSFINRGKSA